MEHRHARNFKDLTGLKFDRWTALEFLGMDENHRSYWLCRCDCGTIRKIQRHQLIAGHSRSCGCLHKEETSERNTIHGFAVQKTEKYRLYKIFTDMHTRCENPNCKKYQNYGGRGITICEEWKSFVNFAKWALENGYKSNLTIDRKDGDEGYCPNNCRWVTKRENALNKKSIRNITINGVAHSLIEWSEISGINPHTIKHRLQRGWNPEDVLNPPIKNQSKDIHGRFTNKTA